MCSARLEFCFPSIFLTLCPAGISNLKSEIFRRNLSPGRTKLHAFRLVQFAKVVFLDSDLLFLHNADSLFQNGDGTHTDGPWSPFNSGLVVIEPSQHAYETLLATVREGDFDYQTGWRRKWKDVELYVDEPHGKWRLTNAETTQGLFFYYFHHHTMSYRVLNRSIWNYQGIEPIPPETTVLHFTGCGKPTAAEAVERCPRAIQHWKRLRAEIVGSAGPAVIIGIGTG